MQILKCHHHHHHHHHVQEGLGLIPVPCKSSKWNWSLHLFLCRPMCLRPFGLYFSACLGILFVSILCMCCSHFSWYCIVCKFDVRKSVHHHTIQINQPTRCNNFTSLLLDVYVWLNMFRAPLRPSSGAYNCTRSLWYYRWSVAVGTLLVAVCQTTTNNAAVVR